MKDEPTKFSDEIEKKRNSLCVDWEKKFGTGRDSIRAVLEKYL